MNTKPWMTNLQSWDPLTRTLKEHTPSHKYKLYALGKNKGAEYVVRMRRPGKWIIIETLAERGGSESGWSKGKYKFSPQDASLTRVMKYGEVVGVLLAARQRTHT